MNYKTLTQIQECAKTYLQPVIQTSQLAETKIINKDNNPKGNSKNKKKEAQKSNKSQKKVTEQQAYQPIKKEEVQVEVNQQLEVWQQAVILSEIIGPPVSKRRRGYRNRVGRI